MGSDEGTKKKQVNIRIPSDLIDIIKKEAEYEKLNDTDIYIRAIKEHIERLSSQICQGCKTVNKPEANFCCHCGLPLNPEGLAEFERIREYIQHNPGVLIFPSKKE